MKVFEEVNVPVGVPVKEEPELGVWLPVEVTDGETEGVGEGVYVGEVLLVGVKEPVCVRVCVRVLVCEREEV